MTDITSHEIILETKTLTLHQAEGQPYVTLGNLARLLGQDEGIARNRLEHLLRRVADMFPRGWVRSLKPSEVTGEPDVALCIPAALIMLAGSRARDIAALHHALARSLATLPLPHSA